MDVFDLIDKSYEFTDQDKSIMRLLKAVSIELVDGSDYEDLYLALWRADGFKKVHVTFTILDT